MTFEESANILAILFANYHSSFKNFSEANAAAVANTWSIAFADVPAAIVYIAVMKWIDTERFPPKICELKEIISRTLYYEAEEALASHKKHNCLTEKAAAKYQLIFDVACRMRSNRKELTLSNFIDAEGEYLLLLE